MGKKNGSTTFSDVLLRGEKPNEKSKATAIYFRDYVMRMRRRRRRFLAAFARDGSSEDCEAAALRDGPRALYKTSIKHHPPI